MKMYFILLYQGVWHYRISYKTAQEKLTKLLQETWERKKTEIEYSEDE